MRATQQVPASSPRYVSVLGGFVPLAAAWDGERGQALFSSEPSAKWFIRRHRARLIEAQALLMHEGRLHFHPERFARVQLEVGLEGVKRVAA